KRHTQRLYLEPLEDRRLLATCHVVRLGDLNAGHDLGTGQARGDLRFCINYANNNPGPDTIDFKVTGTINLTSALPDLASDIDILGPGPYQLTIQRSSAETFRIFNILFGVTVHLSGLTVSHGSIVQSEGAGIRNVGNLAISNCHILENVVTTKPQDLPARGGG